MTNQIDFEKKLDEFIEKNLGKTAENQKLSKLNLNEKAEIAFNILKMKKQWGDDDSPPSQIKTPIQKDNPKNNTSLSKTINSKVEPAIKENVATIKIIPNPNFISIAEWHNNLKISRSEELNNLIDFEAASEEIGYLMPEEAEIMSYNEKVRNAQDFIRLYKSNYHSEVDF